MKKKSNHPPLHTIIRHLELWLLPIFKSHPELSIDKRFPLRESLHSIHLREHIERCWTNELLASIDSNRKPRFLYAAWRCYGPAYAIVSTCLLIIELLGVLQALLFYYYVFEPTFIIVSSLWGVSLLYVVIQHLWKASVTHMGLQLRVSLQTLLLKKVLLIDTNNVQNEILNSLVMKVFRRLSNLDNLFLYTPYIIVASLYTIIVAVVLAEYYIISTNAIILTMIVLFVLIPYQVLLAYRTDAARKRYIRQNLPLDTILNEYRRSWDEIKAYGLSRNIIKSVRNHRMAARATKLTFYLYESVLFLISLNYTKVVTMVFLMAHSWFNEYLPEEKVILLLAFLEIFMYPMSERLARAIPLTAEFVKTLNLMQDVLMMLDKATPNIEEGRKYSENLIVMNKVQAISSPSLTLHCDHLVIKRGQTVAFPYEINQQTKKTLIRILTGEIDLHEGTANIYGKVSFCSKEPWLFPRASVKQNILSHHFYNSQKYQRVIYMCNLNHDFNCLPKGENTIIGCKGDFNVTRELAMKISIARVLYREAEVYIFDEIFDLLTAQASNRLVHRILSRCVKERKCIVLFSHRPWLVRQTQRSFNIVYDQIRELDFRKEKIEFLSDYIETEEEPPEEDVSEESFSNEKFTSDFRDVRVAWKVTQHSPMPKHISPMDIKMKREKGSISEKKAMTVSNGLLKRWVHPFRRVGSAMLCSVMLGIIMSSLSMNMISAIWLYICLNDFATNFGITCLCIMSQSKPIQRIGKELQVATTALWSILPPLIDDEVLQMLLGLSIATSTFLLIQYYWLVNNVLDGVYEGLTSTLLSLKRWQRRERESILLIMQSLQPKLDTNFTPALIQCLKIWLIYLVVVIMMFVYAPITLIQGGAMTLCILYIGKYCAGYVTKLRHLQDELWGIVEVYYKFKDEQILSIRSLESSEKYRAMFHEHMDNYTAIQYMAKSAMEGLSFWMGLVSVVNMGLLLIMGVVKDDGVNNSIAVFFSLLLPNLFPLLIQHTINLFYYSGHINMALMYTNDDFQEVTLDADDQRKDNACNEEGFVESKFVVCKVENRIVYLHFTVNPRQLVGVLGDGKFAVPALLYGFCEILNGVVCIEKAFDTLRNGYVPKDPHIFNGPLIKAISFGKCVTEDVMWKAIEKVGLVQEVGNLPFGLNTTSDDWRGIFSHHQRQLLFLAASIVANTEVLIVEFDSTMCSGTEEEDVMTKARKYLSNSTIFILTNRLRTALETEKLMVFKTGALLEFKSTPELVADSSSCLNNYINVIKQRSIRKELRGIPNVPPHLTIPENDLDCGSSEC